MLAALLLGLAAGQSLTPIPDVTLLVDNDGYNTTDSLRSLIEAASKVRGRQFHFGFAYDPGANTTLDELARVRLKDTYNHGVAENFCKWVFTEPFENQPDLRPCNRAKYFFGNQSATFRVAQLVWHIQLPPSWLPGDFSAAELQDVVIPRHVANTSAGMGEYVSVDVLNELVSDAAAPGDSPFECIRKKMVWPTTKSDTNPQPLLQDMTFVEKAMQAASDNTMARTYLNDYNIGGNNSKTECYYNIATYLKNKNVSFDGIGFQSHVGARTNNFDDKTSLKKTFKRFADLGLDTPITEFDVWIQDNTQASRRWQAAIYGDYLDACLYSSNCNEFVIWGLTDANSWLLTYPGDWGVRQALPIDDQGQPKLNYYEMKARLRRYIAGAGEVCDSASGTSCNLSLYPASQLQSSQSPSSAQPSPSSATTQPTSNGSKLTYSLTALILYITASGFTNN